MCRTVCTRGAVCLPAKCTCTDYGKQSQQIGELNRHAAIFKCVYASNQYDRVLVDFGVNIRVPECWFRAQVLCNLLLDLLSRHGLCWRSLCIRRLLFCGRLMPLG